MEKIVQRIIDKIDDSKEYTIQELKEFCEPKFIPKEFSSTEDISDIKDELKAFILGCELFFKLTKKKYNGDNQKIKEAGIYQFLQATLQDEATSIISDTYYLENLLELYGKDIEKFDRPLVHGMVDSYSTVGLTRDLNQDSFRVSSSGDILIVADGVGGGEHGEEASKRACDATFKYLKRRYEEYKNINEDQLTDIILKDLRYAMIEEANKSVIDYADKNSIGTIGTTLSIALIYNQKLYVGHVGDSRIYRIRENKETESITEDHSLPEVLCRNGEISEEDKQNYKKNILVYVIGKEDLKEENLNVFCADEKLTTDTLFLCSDGVWDIKGIEDKFTDDVEDLKRYILDSIPSDNATFVRCKFNYKEKRIPVNVKPIKEDRVEENPFKIDFVDNWKAIKNDEDELQKKEKPTTSTIDSNGRKDDIPKIIEEDKNSLEDKILWTLMGGVILGIGYLLYISGLFSGSSDINNTTPIVQKDTAKTTHNLVTKNTSANSTTLPPKEENISKSLSVEETKTNEDEEIRVKKEPNPKEAEVNYDTPIKYVPITRTKHTTRVKQQTKRIIKEITAKLDTTKYKKSDLLTIGNTKIWFGKNYIQTNKRDCFGLIFNNEEKRHKYRCILNTNISNPEITKELKKQKIGKISIGNHGNKIWIVVTHNNQYETRATTISVKNKEYKEEIIFNRKEEVKIEDKNKTTNIKKKAYQTPLITIPRIKDWSDSDGLYLGGGGQDWVASFNKNVITLKNGHCYSKNEKWVCIIPNKKIEKFTRITSRLKYQEFAKNIVLNTDYEKYNVRMVITLKEGYIASKKSENGKQILVFKKIY